MRYFAALTILFMAFATMASAGEAPLLADLVSSGKLPPVAERLPEEPRVMQIDESTQRTPGSRAAPSAC